MNTKQIQITFVILLLSLFLVPMIYLEHWWGTQIGWPWGFYNVIPNPINGTSGFHPIWEMFPTFPPVDAIYYAALAAVIGALIDTALILVSLMATSRMWFVRLTAILNIGFGAAVLAITSWYTTVAGSLVFSPLAIVLLVMGGIILFQTTRD